jgi:hypothetical protein
MTNERSTFRVVVRARGVLSTSICAIAIGLLHGCAQPCAGFDSSVPSELRIRALSDVQLDTFCREQATYVWYALDHAIYARAFCLQSVLDGLSRPEVIDQASCEAALSACLAEPHHIPYAFDCEVPGPDDDLSSYSEITVGWREACVTQEVCVTWPTLAAELSCELFGDSAALSGVWRRAFSPDACQIAI